MCHSQEIQVIDNRPLSMLGNKISSGSVHFVCLKTHENRAREITERLHRQKRAGQRHGLRDLLKIKSDRTGRGVEKKGGIMGVALLLPSLLSLLSAIRVLHHSESHLLSDSFTLLSQSLSLNLSPQRLNQAAGFKHTLFFTVLALWAKLTAICGAVKLLPSSASLEQCYMI